MKAKNSRGKKARVGPSLSDPCLMFFNLHFVPIFFYHRFQRNTSSQGASP